MSSFISLLLFSLIFPFSFTNELELRIQIIGWRTVQSLKQLEFCEPENRFSVSLGKQRNNGLEKLAPKPTGHYEIVTFQLPEEWEKEMTNGLAGEILDNNLFQLGVSVITERIIHHRLCDFRFTSRYRNFVKVELSSTGNVATVRSIVQQKMPVRNLLFKTLAIHDDAVGEQLGDDMLLKRIECQTPDGGPWTIGDASPGQNVLLAKAKPVCQGSVYLMYYAQDVEEIGKTGRQEMPKQPVQILCDEAVHEFPKINIYHIGFNRNGRFTCHLEILSMDGQVEQSILGSQKENVMDIWPQVAEKLKILNEIPSSEAKRRKIYQHVLAVGNRLGEQQQHHLNEMLAKVQSFQLPQLPSPNTQQTQAYIPFITAKPTSEQQQEIVDAYVKSNVKVEGICSKVKNYRDKYLNSEKTTLNEILNTDEMKTLTKALAYLGQVAECQLGAQAVATGLGIGQTTVRTKWTNLAIRKNRKTTNSTNPPLEEKKFKQILKTVKEDSQRHALEVVGESSSTQQQGEQQQHQLTEVPHIQKVQAHVQQQPHAYVQQNQEQDHVRQHHEQGHVQQDQEQGHVRQDQEQGHVQQHQEQSHVQQQQIHVQQQQQVDVQQQPHAYVQQNQEQGHVRQLQEQTHVQQHHEQGHVQQHQEQSNVQQQQIHVQQQQQVGVQQQQQQSHIQQQQEHVQQQEQQAYVQQQPAYFQQQQEHVQQQAYVQQQQQAHVQQQPAYLQQEQQEHIQQQEQQAYIQQQQQAHVQQQQRYANHTQTNEEMEPLISQNELDHLLAQLEEDERHSNQHSPFASASAAAAQQEHLNNPVSINEFDPTNIEQMQQQQPSSSAEHLWSSSSMTVAESSRGKAVQEQKHQQNFAPPLDHDSDREDSDEFIKSLLQLD